VTCTTIDLLVEEYGLHHVDLVKIDVEGAELQVLRGMQATLKRFRPKIITELCPSLLDGFSMTLDMVQKYFSGRGYSMIPLEEDCMGRTTNYLCVPVEYSESAYTGYPRSGRAISEH